MTCPRWLWNVDLFATVPDGLEILDRGHIMGKGWDCTGSIRGGAGSQSGQTSGLARDVKWQEGTLW